MDTARTIDELYSWTKTDKFLNAANEIIDKMGWDTAKAGNKAKPIREAWILGEVGKLLKASHSKLTATEQPDGLLKFKGGFTIPVEVTELLEKGRRRGDEIEDDKVVHIPQEKLEYLEANNSRWLEEAIDKKKRKNYDSGTLLVIYHNTGVFSSDLIRQEHEELLLRVDTNKIFGILILQGQELHGISTLRKLEDKIKGS